MVKKSSRKITVNMEGVENFAPPPEGDYKIGIDEVTKEVSESKNDYLAWVFKIADGKNKGKKLFYNTSLQPQALWNLRGVLEAFGIDVPDGSMDLDLDEIQDCEELAGCTVEHETYQGKPRARIVDVFSAENLNGGEGDDDDDDEKGEKNSDAPSREDVMTLDEDELEEVNEQFDLGVDLSKVKKLKAKREAIADALEEAGSGGKDDDGDSEDGEDEKLSREDIMALDEEELEELNEKEDLGVKLKKIKKLKDQREAIADAYEEKVGAGESDDEESEDKITEESIEEMGKGDLAEFVKKHKLKVKLEGTTSKQRRAVIKAAKAADLIEEEDDE